MVRLYSGCNVSVLGISAARHHRIAPCAADWCRAEFTGARLGFPTYPRPQSDLPARWMGVLDVGGGARVCPGTQGVLRRKEEDVSSGPR